MLYHQFYASVTVTIQTNCKKKKKQSLQLVLPLPEGVSVDKTSFQIEPNSSTSINITWKADRIGNARESIEFKLNKKHRVRAVLTSTVLKTTKKVTKIVMCAKNNLTVFCFSFCFWFSENL